MRLLELLALCSVAAALTPLQPNSRVVNKATAAKAIAIPQSEADSVLLVQESKEQQRSILPPQDAWVANLDYEAFGKDVAALGKELVQGGGQDDVNHLNKMVAWRNIAAVIGCATMWADPNPLTVLALSTWTYASWTMIGKLKNTNAFLLMVYWKPLTNPSPKS
jgi:hypothetical protein